MSTHKPSKQLADLIRRVEALENAAKEKTNQTTISLRHHWFQDWYKKLGFDLPIKLPNVTDEEYEKRKNNGQELFFRPASSAVSYEQFMVTCGQGNHWTITDAGERAKIGFEPTETGYWFWAEVQESCLRLGTSWNDFMRATKLLSLEEYVIVWHAHKAATGTLLDQPTFCWLRTRFGSGALCAYEGDGGVSVDGYGLEGLSIPYGDFGGRSAEVAAA